MVIEGIYHCSDCPARYICNQEIRDKPPCKNFLRSLIDFREDSMCQGADSRCEECDYIDPDTPSTETIVEMFKNIENPYREIDTMLLQGALDLGKLVKKIGVEKIREALARI